jgi:hypothetical protein
MTVEIGRGPLETPPDEDSWVWRMCQFAKDFTDSQGRQYKVYAVDACTLEAICGIVDYQTYCFRTSVDWAHADSPFVYLFVDSDGTAPRDDDSANVYFYDNAGLFHGRSSFLCGDPDGSCGVDIDDVVFLINYIFLSGPPPEPYESGDADCSGSVDIDDIVCLISYIFSGGYAPCDTDGDGVPNC